MMRKGYTAQEMLEAANVVDDVSINDNGEYYYEKYDKFNPDIVRDMLRQAADTIEREIEAKDEEIAKLTADNVHNESLLRKAGSTVVELMNRMNAQHEEIKELRKLVAELADALETINTKLDFDPSIDFKWTIGDEEFESLHTGALVDKAKEMIGGGK